MPALFLPEDAGEQDLSCLGGAGERDLSFLGDVGKEDLDCAGERYLSLLGDVGKLDLDDLVSGICLFGRVLVSRI